MPLRRLGASTKYVVVEMLVASVWPYAMITRMFPRHSAMRANCASATAPPENMPQRKLDKS